MKYILLPALFASLTLFAAPKADDAIPGTAAWWMPRHEEVLRLEKAKQPEVLFIGDSITHRWGGEPADPRAAIGAAVFERYYAKRRVANLGFASDRTWHVIWRLKHGELEGVSPKVAVIMIGTNNDPLPGISAEETARGVKTICELVRKATPSTRILLLGLFPRERKGDAAFSSFPKAVNAHLAKLDGHDGITYLDIGDKLGLSDGRCRPGLFSDGVHPTAAGYKVWAEAMEPTLSRLLNDTPVAPAK